MPSLKLLLQVFGKSASGQAFPSSKGGARLELDTSTRNYTAPCDGYFSIYTNTVPNSIDMYGRGLTGDGTIRTRFATYARDGGPLSLTIPLQKGQSVVFTATDNIEEVWFTPSGGGAS